MLPVSYLERCKGASRFRRSGAEPPTNTSRDYGMASGLAWLASDQHMLQRHLCATSPMPWATVRASVIERTARMASPDIGRLEEVREHIGEGNIMGSPDGDPRTWALMWHIGYADRACMPERERRTSTGEGAAPVGVD